MYEEELIYKNVSPRTERRLLREKASLGRSIGSMAKMRKRVVPFDANAIDADGDQFVQDGTIWQRPDTRMPGKPSFEFGRRQNNYKPLRPGTIDESQDTEGLSSGATFTTILKGAEKPDTEKKKKIKEGKDLVISQMSIGVDQTEELVDVFGSVQDIPVLTEEEVEAKAKIHQAFCDALSGEFEVEKDIIIEARNGEKINLGKRLKVVPVIVEESWRYTGSPDSKKLAVSKLVTTDEIDPEEVSEGIKSEGLLYKIFDGEIPDRYTSVEIELTIRPADDAAAQRLIDAGAPESMYSSLHYPTDPRSGIRYVPSYPNEKPRYISLGDAQRTFGIFGDGSVQVSHDSLTIAKEARSFGIGSAFNARNEGIYEELGAKAIITTGASNTSGMKGATHWPRNGFTWATEGSKQKFLQILYVGAEENENSKYLADNVANEILSLITKLPDGTFDTSATEEQLASLPGVDAIFQDAEAQIGYVRPISENAKLTDEEKKEAKESWLKGISQDDEIGLSSGKKAKKDRRAERENKKTAIRAYTLAEDLSTEEKGGKLVDPDMQMMASSIDEIFEAAMQNISDEFVVSPGLDPDMATDLIISGFEISADQIGSPEASLQKVIDLYNDKYNTNHRVASVVMKMLLERPELSDDARKKILETIFPDTKEREEAIRPIHESIDYSHSSAQTTNSNTPIHSFSYMTLRPIVPGDPDAFKGMTPKQIAKIVVPENDDMLLEMATEMAFGQNAQDVKRIFLRMRSGDKSLSRTEMMVAQEYQTLLGKLAGSFIDKNGIGVSYDPVHIKNLRHYIERSLDESPLFLEAARKFGMPPVVPMEMFIDGAYEPQTGGVTFQSFNIIGINTNLLDKKEPGGRGTAQVNIYDLLKNYAITSTTDIVRHEWGHYFQSVIDKALGIISDNDTKINALIMENNPRIRDLLKHLSPQTRAELMLKMSLFNGFSPAPAKERVLNKLIQSLFSDRVQDLIDDITVLPENSTARKQKISELRKLIPQILDDPRYANQVVNATQYASSHEAELFAEIVKDFLSSNFSSREIYFNARTTELMEFIFGLLDRDS